MIPKILIADSISQRGIDEMTRDGALEVSVKTGMKESDLIEIIPEFNGIVVRSQTKVTAPIVNAGTRLRVIGRAGVGVDNVDVEAATRRGVIVMNAPGGNTISTAEHAFSLLLCVARKIPQADALLRGGKWDRKNLEGVEMFNKTLGIVGMGRIGSELSRRAIAFGMRVVAFDPYLSATRARTLQVELVDELDDLLATADFITLHTPLTEQTKNVIDAKALAAMKKGVRLINCARGGLVDEQALREALERGQVAGAAFDVFTQEPAQNNPLFGHPNVVCTPHLGAATAEAQENVALQIAEQMADYLLRGAISNAVNFPSITAEEAPGLRPFIDLADKLGSFAGQLTESGIKKVKISYEGGVAGMNTKALTSAAVAGLLRPMLQQVNVVSAPALAKERGIVIEETTRDTSDDFGSLIRLSVDTERQSRWVSGTVFADGRPRIVNIKGIRMDANFGPSMIYITNLDKPGFIGRFSSVLGDAGINIATFHVGRDFPGGNAIALIEIDGELPPQVLAAVRALPQVQQAKTLTF